MPVSLRVARLQAGDDLSALVAQPERLVEVGVIARAARNRRRASEAADRRPARRASFAARSTGHWSRRKPGPDGRIREFRVWSPVCVQQLPRYRFCRFESGADHVEIARAAAVEPEPRKRAKHVGHAGKRRRGRAARSSCRSTKNSTPSSRAVDRSRVGERARQPLGEEPRAGRTPRAVDRGEQRARAAAGGRPKQFEVGARRRIDPHRLAVARAAAAARSAGASRSASCRHRR